eukprot:symbB.v1.2.031404.t1/scaffold3638.1/size52812/5
MEKAARGKDSETNRSEQSQLQEALLEKAKQDMQRLEKEYGAKLATSSKWDREFYDKQPRSKELRFVTIYPTVTCYNHYSLADDMSNGAAKGAGGASSP